MNSNRAEAAKQGQGDHTLMHWFMHVFNSPPWVNEGIVRLGHLLHFSKRAMSMARMATTYLHQIKYRYFLYSLEAWAHLHLLILEIVEHGLSKKQRVSQTVDTKELCYICCQPVTIGKDEALFYTGKCQQWLHHYCASISVKCYKAIIDNSRPYCCPCCY